MKFASTVAFAALVAACFTSEAAALPRVHSSVHRALRQQATVNIFITLKDGTAPALNAVQESEFATRGQKIASLVQSLETNAGSSQTEVKSLLAKESGSQFTSFKSFWITNEIYVENATIELVEQLAALSSIAEIREEEKFSITPPIVPADDAAALADNSTVTEWGVGKINTKAVWATGNTGQNVVVGVIDSGVRGTHEALAPSYRNDGFSWFDPETRREAPYDSGNHGSHVTGSITGAAGLGVAPGAKWIGCKGCRTSSCPQSDLLGCIQFMTCPTNPSGTVKDCSKAPRVVNNSWGGGQGTTTFARAIDAWRAAGIIPVVANGNTGPQCRTVVSPADYATVISVGSTDVNDLLARTSGKGPTVAGLLKPDISAPGVSVRSAGGSSDSAYLLDSGTSMASPHVTGVIALMLNAKPDLTFDQIKTALETTAVKTVQASGFTCGGTPDSTWPNNQYGHGRVDAAAAVAFVRAL